MSCHHPFCFFVTSVLVSRFLECFVISWPRGLCLAVDDKVRESYSMYEVGFYSTRGFLRFHNQRYERTLIAIRCSISLFHSYLGLLYTVDQPSGHVYERSFVLSSVVVNRMITDPQRFVRSAPKDVRTLRTATMRKRYCGLQVWELSELVSD